MDATRGMCYFYCVCLAVELSEQQAKVKVLLTAEQSLQARLTQADQVIVDLKATSHDLERQCKNVTAHDSSVERDVAELRRQLRDVTEVRRQLREVELEKSRLERMQNDTRSDTDRQQKVQPSTVDVCACVRLCVVSVRACVLAYVKRNKNTISLQCCVSSSFLIFNFVPRFCG